MGWCVSGFSQKISGLFKGTEPGVLSDPPPAPLLMCMPHLAVVILNCWWKVLWGKVFMKSCRCGRTDHHWRPDETQLRAATTNRLRVRATRQEGSKVSPSVNVLMFSQSLAVSFSSLRDLKTSTHFVDDPFASEPFQDLITALKGALSGSLEALMLGLMKSTAQYDASELNTSMKVRISRALTEVLHWSTILKYLYVSQMFPC